MYRNYIVGAWNQDNSHFAVGDTNEQLIKNVVADAIDSQTNVVIVGGCLSCYQCDDCFDDIKSASSSVNSTFFLKQDLYLLTYHQSRNDATRKTMASYVNAAASSKGISFTYSQAYGSSGAYSCHFFIDVKSKTVHVYQGADGITNAEINKIKELLGDVPAKSRYTVTFKDYNGATLKTQQVYETYDAVPPSAPARSGYEFTGWSSSYTSIARNTTCTAQYSATVPFYTVTFKDYNGATLKTQRVQEGASATPPSDPSRAGYIFIGWSNAWTNVHANVTAIAEYEKDTGMYKNAVPPYCFRNCTSLESIKLPDNIKTIYDYGFARCTNLTNINCPSQLTSLREGAFNGCCNLSNFIFGDKLIVIGPGAFTNNPISSFELNNITLIGAYAFNDYSCSQHPKTVKIKTCLQEIGILAFGRKLQLIDMTDFTSNSSCPGIFQYVSADNDDYSSIFGHTGTFNLASNGKIKFRDLATSLHFYADANWKTYSDYFDPQPGREIHFNGNAAKAGDIDDITCLINSSWTCPYFSYVDGEMKYECQSFNTKADGTGDSYEPGTSYPCPSSDLTLYATNYKSFKKGIYVVLAPVSNAKIGSRSLTPLTGFGNDATRLTDMINASTASSNIAEIKDLRDSKGTKKAILNAIEEGCEHELLITYIGDHGGEGYVCVADGKIAAKTYYNAVAKAKGRVFSIFAVCHAASMAKTFSSALPDESSSNNEESYSNEIASNEMSSNEYIEDLNDCKGFDWAQGAVDYFNELRKSQEQQAQNSSENSRLMAASSKTEITIPDMLYWCACKADESSWMHGENDSKSDPLDIGKYGTGHYLVTGMKIAFTGEKQTTYTYRQLWDDFSTKAPAKITYDQDASGGIICPGSNTQTPVKSVIGKSFEDRLMFT